MMNRLQSCEISPQEADAHGLFELASAFPHAEAKDLFRDLPLFLLHLSQGKFAYLFSPHMLPHVVHRIGC